MDACGAIFSDAKAFMRFLKHKTLKGWKADQSYMHEWMLQLTLISTPQVFSIESDIYGQEQVQNWAKLYIKKICTIEVQKLLYLWEVQEAYSTVQTFAPQDV